MPAVFDDVVDAGRIEAHSGVDASGWEFGVTTDQGASMRHDLARLRAKVEAPLPPAGYSPLRGEKQPLCVLPSWGRWRRRPRRRRRGPPHGHARSHAHAVHRPRHTRLAAQRAHALRMEMTISKAALWDGIQRRQTGARFRRQVPIGIWIVDFASFSPRLVIEVDDESHRWRDETEWSREIESRGFTILRFDNKEIAQHPDDAVDTVRNWVQWLREGRDPEAD